MFLDGLEIKFNFNQYTSYSKTPLINKKTKKQKTLILLKMSRREAEGDCHFR